MTTRMRLRGLKIMIIGDHRKQPSPQPGKELLLGIVYQKRFQCLRALDSAIPLCFSFLLLCFVSLLLSLVSKKKSDVAIVSTNEFILNLTMGIQMKRN